MNDPLTISIIIDYLYRYALTYIIGILGSFTRDGYDTLTKKNPINILKVLISPCFTSMILCMVYDYFTIKFSVYIFLSFFLGLWSFSILESSFSTKIIMIIVKNIAKEVANPVIKGIGEGIEEIKETKEEESNLRERDENNPEE